eukprot:7988791-Prorocentrum_lima.AAC.1
MLRTWCLLYCRVGLATRTMERCTARANWVLLPATPAFTTSFEEGFAVFYNIVADFQVNNASVRNAY